MRSSTMPGAEVKARPTASASPPIPPRTACRWRAQHRLTATGLFEMTPSWLVSMLVHLCLMLFLASLVVPLGTHTRLDQLLLSFESVRESEMDQAPQAVTVPQADAPQRDEPPAEAAPQPIDQAGEHQQQREAAPMTWLPQNIDWSIVAKALRRPKAAEKTEPRSRVLRIEPVGRIDASVEKAARWVEQPNDYDDVVDRFIAYDIGQLRGAEGQQAVSRFRRLGTDAIPALVRGLNKSARIHASCPVGVISRKLTELVYATDDEDLLNYAIRNLGRDVPPNAAHLRRINELRQQMARVVGSRSERIVGRLAELGWSVDDATVEQIALKLSSGKLQAAIQNGNPQARQAAAMAVLIHADEFDTRESWKLGHALANALESETDSQIQELLQQTSWQLAGDSNLPQAMSGAAWRDYWSHQGQVQLMIGLSTPRLIRQLKDGDESVRTAAMQALLETNRSLHDSSRYQIADSIIQDLESKSLRTADLSYRTLVHLAGGVNGGGHSVQRWRNYWKSHYFHRTIVPRAESYLRQARFLEEGGKRAAAERHYRRLIENFPDTPAAKKAEHRLESILQLNQS